MKKLIPKIVKYDGIRYEFYKKIKKNMYMYKGIINGCRICFSEFDLGINEKNIETKTVRLNQTNYSKAYW